MPYEIADESGEEMLLNTSFTASQKSEPFRIALSNLAIYLPRKKAFAMKDPTYFERVPFSNVIEVRIHRIKPYFMWSLAAAMILVGAVTTVWMMMPVLRGEGGKVSGYPPAIVVVGLVIPFIAGRRFSLDVKTTGKPFRWKPELLVDKKSRTKVDNYLSEIGNACQKAGLNVVDERN